MIARQGRFVEYSVFGKETSVDWTIISDAKGRCTHYIITLQSCMVAEKDTTGVRSNSHL